MKKVIVALAMALFASGAYAGDFPDISIGELKEAINARKVTVIDVNGKDTWAQGHIPGAIEFGASKGNLAALLPKDKDALVVAYCGGPSCGAYAAAAKAAKALGYTNVKHLVAGISGWKQAGEKMEKAE